MATDIIKTIGATSSPVVPDYTSLQAWEDALPANLVTADQRHIGECLDQGTFTSALTIAGQTTDATRYIFLRCAAGASFKDKAAVRSTALTFNESNGVAIKTTGAAITCGIPYSRYEGLQVKRTGYAGMSAFSAYGSYNTIDSCIVHGTATPGANDTTFKVINTIMIVPSGQYGPGGRAKYYGCTFVCEASNGSYGVTSSYNGMLLKNCAVFGFANFSNGSTVAGSDYNATDAASASTGTHNLTSLTFADQFESTTNDFRAVASGDLQAGTPDATNTPVDITGITRDAVVPWIGAWEVDEMSSSSSSLSSSVSSQSSSSSSVSSQSSSFSSLSSISSSSSSSSLSSDSSSVSSQSSSSSSSQSSLSSQSSSSSSSQSSSSSSSTSPSSSSSSSSLSSSSSFGEYVCGSLYTQPRLDGVLIINAC